MTQVSGEVAILRQRIRGADGNKAPLLIGGFEAKRIAQATSARGAENTLFVTVTPNIDWEPALWRARGVVVVVTGLRGAATPDSEQLALVDMSPHWHPAAAWTQSTGTLALQVRQNATVGAGDSLWFSFQLRNPQSAHAAAAVSVWAASLPRNQSASYEWLTTAGGVAAGTEGPGNISEGIMLASVQGMDAGDKAPLEVAGFLTATLSHSSVAQSARTCLAALIVASSQPATCNAGSQSARTCLAALVASRENGAGEVVQECSSNTLGVGFATNVALPAGTRVRVTGLTGALDAGTVLGSQVALRANVTALQGAAAAAMQAAGSGVTAWDARVLENETRAATVFAPTAAWNASEGSLDIIVDNETLPLALYRVEVDVLNAAGPRAAANATLAADGDVSIAATPLEARGALPALQVAGWDEATIGQQRPWPGVPNTLTVTLRSNTRIPPDDEIFVRGLTGTSTPATDALPVRGAQLAGGREVFANGHDDGNQTAEWEPAAGVLRLRLREALPAQQPLLFNFTLHNPAGGQDPPEVRVECVGAARIWPVTMSGPGGNQAALLVADFMTATLSQQTPGALRNNTLSLVLSVRAALPPRTLLRVTGLTGTSTPDQLLPVAGNASKFTTAFARWHRVSGTLTITVANEIPAKIVSVLRVTLQNGYVPQHSPSVWVSATSGSEQYAVANASDSLSANTSNTSLGTSHPNQTVSAGVVTMPEQLLGKASGNAAPLLIAGLDVRMQQSSSAKGARNNLTMTLTANAHLPEGSELVLAGLRGASPVAQAAESSVGQALTQCQDSFGTACDAVLLSAGAESGFARAWLWRPGVEGSSSAAGAEAQAVDWEAKFDVVHRGFGNCSNQNCSECTCSALGVVQCPASLRSCFCGCSPRTARVRLTLPVPGLLANVEYVLLLPLRNPVLAQASPAITAEVMGSVPVYASAIKKPAITSPTTGAQAPLAVASTFLNAVAVQSTPSAGALNSICVRFASLDVIRATDAVVLTISGLVGAAAPDSGAVSLRPSCNASDFPRRAVAASGAWNRSLGQLVVAFTADVQAQSVTGFSINLTNPLQGQSSPALTIQSSGLLHMPQALRSAGGNSAPLLVASLVQASLEQRNPFVGARNELRFSLVSNVFLPPSSRIFVDGFPRNISLQTAEASGHAHVSSTLRADMSNNVSEWLQQNVSWYAIQGILVATLRRGLQANVSYTWGIALVNPVQPRESLSSARIWVNGGGIDVSPKSMLLGKYNLAPLFTTGWTMKSIRQSSIAAAGINTLTVSLQVIVECASN